MKKTHFLHDVRSYCMRALCLSLLLSHAVFFMQAQTCALSCSDVVYSLGSSCLENVVLADLSITMSNCAGPFTIEIEELDESVNYGDVVDASLIGGTYNYIVTDVSGNSCWANITIIDEQDPVFTCPVDVSISCLEYIENVPDVPALTAADVMDCSDFEIDSIDVLVVDPDCNATNWGVITRTYTVTDEHGNVAQCDQIITIENVVVNTVVFPPSVQASCTAYDTLTVDITGVPIINGIETAAGHYCNIRVVFFDQVAQTCGAGFKILRTWSIIDLCSGNTTDTDIQLIDILDDEAAQFTPPMDFTVSADNTNCTASIDFPPVVLSELCTGGLIDGTNNVTITSPGLGVVTTNGGVLTNVPLGTYVFTYTTTDGCNNSFSQDVTVTVEDLNAPIAICDQSIVVPLNNTGYAEVPAINFNSASFDYCGHVYFKVKRMATPVIDCTSDDNPNYNFDDEIRFCCSDFTDSPIMVIVRVYDVYIPAGVILDDDYMGHYSECMVEVFLQDKAGPTIECPNNITIECQDNLMSYIDIDEVLIYDNCNLDETYVEIDDSGLSQCNIGYVNVMYGAIDEFGNENSCTQIITVVNNTPFDGADTLQLQYPLDTILYDCNANVHPSVVGYPIINDDECALTAASYTDEVYEFSEGCRKIKRIWSIMDWCQFDSDAVPLYDPSNGFWTDFQIIKVYDTIPPQVEYNVPNFFINNEIDCGPVNVKVELPLFDDDCTTDPDDFVITYTVTALLSDGQPVVASGSGCVQGEFATGEYEILYSISDGCGNSTEFYDEFAVDDVKAPTIVLLDGIAVDLITMPAGEMVQICASDFDKSSSDNCENLSDLHFSFSQFDFGDTCRIFGCNDIGENTITVFLSDNYGNTSSAITTLTIQDNDGLCPILNTTIPAIFGELRTTTNNPLQNAEVQITELGGLEYSCFTDDNGAYAHEELNLNMDYHVIPWLSDDPVQGISTLDIVLIQKHVLGLQELDNTFSLLAADVNNSKSISAADIVDLRRLILGKTTELANAPSWKFIDAEYAFVDINNPFTTDIQTGYSIRDLQDSMNINFVAYKIGDVNHSNSFSSLNDVNNRDTKTKSIHIQNSQLLRNTESEVDLKWSKDEEIAGFQMELDLQEDIQCHGFVFDDAFSGDYFIEENKLRIVGLANDMNAPVDSDQIGTLKLTSSVSTTVQENLTISRTFNSEVYDFQDDTYRIDLRNLPLPELHALEVSNQPNPFSDFTIINFNLTKNETVQLEITDSAGRLIQKETINGIRGRNEYILSANHIDPGIYFYKISNATQSEVNRIMITR